MVKTPEFEMFGNRKLPTKEVKEYWIHKIDPLTTASPIANIGGSDDVNYAIRQCRKKAQEAVGKDYVLLFRVVKHRGDVVYLVLVNFDTFEEWDMREVEGNDAD
jgi:hypothetical protein